MKTLKFAVLGCGFWSRYQIAAWRELPGAELVAVYNRTRSKAEDAARRFGVGRVYDDPEELLTAEKVDFVDVITSVETHRSLVELAARHGVSVICQKPLSTSLADAEAMVAACRDAGVSMMVHENWRWQRPLRELKRTLEDADLGRAFRARVQFSSSFPVFDNQPFLRGLDRFILTDVGSHILDAARYLFGETSSLYCRTTRVRQDIRGEDVATVVMDMAGTTVTCEMSYATCWERERFPETYVFVECERGSVELGPDFRISVTTPDGTRSRRCPPRVWPWADPAYAIVHDSIVGCNANLVGALAGDGPAETTGEDNVKTVRLVYGAYESAERGSVVFPQACARERLATVS